MRRGFWIKWRHACIPLVLVSRHLNGHCSVTCDDIRGGYLAAAHLLDLDHRDMAILAGELYARTGRDRMTGFLACCKERGVHVPKQRILEGPFDTISSRQGGDRLFKQSKSPTAIFAVNDFLAIGLIGAARDHGLRPGHDIATVGFNDTPLAAELPIALTTIRSPMHAMGYRGMELLLKQIGGERTESERLMLTLMVRAGASPDTEPQKIINV